MQLMKDNFGRELHADSWILSIYGNCGQATARYYYVKGYAPDGRINVQEYSVVHGHDWRLPEKDRVDRPHHFVEAKKPQTIKEPKSFVVIPFEMVRDLVQ